MRRAEGQAALELVALLPLLVAVALAVGQMLAAGVARELAGQAAQAGAMELVQGEGEAREAALAALPGWSRDRAEIRVRGRRVVVTVAPMGVLPGLAGRLVAERAADAGPAPPGSSS